MRQDGREHGFKMSKVSHSCLCGTGLRRQLTWLKDSTHIDCFIRPYSSLPLRLLWCGNPRNTLTLRISKHTNGIKHVEKQNRNGALTISWVCNCLWILGHWLGGWNSVKLSLHTITLLGHLSSYFVGWIYEANLYRHLWYFWVAYHQEPLLCTSRDGCFPLYRTHFNLQPLAAKLRVFVAQLCHLHASGCSIHPYTSWSGLRHGCHGGVVNPHKPAKTCNSSSLGQKAMPKALLNDMIETCAAKLASCMVYMYCIYLGRHM